MSLTNCIRVIFVFSFKWDMHWLRTKQNQEWLAFTSMSLRFWFLLLVHIKVNITLSSADNVMNFKQWSGPIANTEDCLKQSLLFQHFNIFIKVCFWHITLHQSNAGLFHFQNQQPRLPHQKPPHSPQVMMDHQRNARSTNTTNRSRYDCNYILNFFCTLIQ